MGYFLNAVIGNRQLLETRAGDFLRAMVVPLAQNMALIPITDELLEEIGADGDRGRFEQFTPALDNWLQSISMARQVAYIEAEFHGGSGGQSAIVWSEGAQILEPLHSWEAINEALLLLGVSRGTCRDEFEAIGLPKHRNTKDWLSDALPKIRSGKL